MSGTGQPDYQGAAAALNPSGDYLAATQNLTAARQIAAQVLAGKQIAAGNPGQAAGTLYSSGNLPAAQQETQYAGNQAGTSALAARNYPAAAAGFGVAGDAAGVQGAQSAQFQQFQAIGAYLKNAQPVYQKAYEQHGSIGLSNAVALTGNELVGAGLMNPSQVQQYAQSAMQDPNGFLANVDNIVTKVSYQKLSDTSALETNAFTGAPIAAIAAPQQTVLNTPSGAQTNTQTGVQITPLGGGASPAGAMSATAPAPGSPPSIGAQPLNNPGNLRPVGASTGFNQYSSPAAGYVALSDDLGAKAKDGITTLSALAAKYAPPGENNTAQWAQTVSAAAGIPVDAKIDLSNPNVRGAVLMGVSKAEGTFQQASGVVGGTPSAASPGATTLASTDTGPANRVATDAENNQYNPGGRGFIDAKGAYHSTAGAGDIDNFTPQDIAYNANLIRLTGAPGPSLTASGTMARGAGQQDALNKAQALARQLDQQQGVTPEVRAVRQQTYGNAAKALTQIYGLQQNMSAYATTTEKDFQNVETALKAVPNVTSYRTLNNLLAAYRTERGETAYSKLQVSLNDAQNNYNKVVLGSGDGGGGAVGTESERAEAEEIFPVNAPVPQLLANITQARLGMNNRMAGVNSQIASLHDTMLTGVDGIPHQAIQLLQKQPGTLNYFNQTFGPGTGQMILGQ